MPLAPDKDAQVDTQGPLNALEADRYVEELRPFEFHTFGDAKWTNQHEFLNKLNLQAHVNAALRREALRREALAGAPAPTGEARRNARRDERRRSEKPRGCWRRRADGTLTLYPEGVAIADWGKPRSPATIPCEAASEIMPLPRLRLSVQQRRRRLMVACGCAPLRAGAVGY